MDSETLNQYYYSNFGSQRHFEGQKVNARSNAVVLRKLLDLSQIHSWLDIGTGYGLLLQWLEKKYGIRTEGVELSRQEADYAKKLGLRVHCSLLEDSTLTQSQYDVVSSFEVIEHIPDPTSFLRELKNYVRPGGILVIMTDNFESPPIQKLAGRFPKWIPHTHLSHFAASSLRKCIANVPGLSLERVASYTPCDTVARSWLAPYQAKVPDEDAYDLQATLSSEMNRRYKQYRLRYVLNPAWAWIHTRKNLEHGALMYAVCRRSE